MRDHVELEHTELEGDPGKIFSMKMIKSLPAPFTRQVTEAIKISHAKGTVLNRKEEYNHCILPSLRIDRPPYITREPGR